MSVMNVRNYQAHADFDPDDRLFVGHLAGINDMVSIHADPVAALERAFPDAVDDYSESCDKIGKQPEKPFNGRVMFRVPPQTHGRAALAAQLRGLSLDRWAREALDNQAAADLAAIDGSR